MLRFGIGFAIGLVGCIPREGKPCDPERDDDYNCVGENAFICWCEEYDANGECVDPESATWNQDRACSCDMWGGVACS